MDFAALTGFTISEGRSPGIMRWTFTDTDGREASFQVDGAGVGLAFQTLIGLLQTIAESQPAAQPAEGGATAVGVLPAQRISITAGRHPKEVALHAHIGTVDLAYLVPLDSVVITLGELVSKLYPDPPSVPTH